MIPEVHASTRSGARFSWLAGLILLSTAAAVAGPSADSADKPCVAVLEAEVVAKMPGDERKALAGWLDTLLTESLAKRKDFVTVDRQVLDKVLAEKTAKAGGLTKIDPKDVAASLRPFWSAGILICPVIRQVNPKDNSGKMIVSVEAVLAQTGQLLAELHKQGDWKKGRWANSPKVSEDLERLWQDIRRNLQRNLKCPVVEVADGRLTSKLTRLQWMVDELTDALSSCVGAEHGVVLLTPRHPLSTKEERLLRVMGLSAAKRSDKAAGLVPTSDMRLTTELIETVSGKVSFRKTPITVKLTLHAGDKVVVSKSFGGTVGSSREIRVGAGKWFIEQLGKSAKTSVPADAEALARKLAAEELAYLRSLMSFGYGGRDLEIRLIRRALRAAHLDPTNETATYLVAIHVGDLYSVRGQGDTMACKDRVLAESRKYLDRFGGKVAGHHRRVLGQVISTAYSASCTVRGGGQSYTAILGKPNPRLYPYARANVRAMAEYGYLAETDKRYAGTNVFRVLGHWLRRDLIPVIPDEHLDEEYEYWRGFWKNKAEKVPGDKADPWDLIEAAFQARKKKPDSVRAALQRLADKYPKSQTSVWRLGLEQIIPLYLRASGDAEWKTWKPSFGAGAITITYAEHRAQAKRCYPPFPSVWDYPNLPVLPTRRLTFPKEVLDLGSRAKNRVETYPRIGPLCRAGGDLWFITPTQWDTVDLKVPQYLHIVSEREAFAAGRGGLAVVPRRLHWPKHPRLDLSVKVSGRMNQLTITRVCVTGSGLKQTVWIGTKWHGLARFDKKDKEWTGRWYTQRDGMSSDWISEIFPYRDGKGAKLLIGGPINNKLYSRRPGLWTLDPNSHSVSVIDEKKLKPWAAVMTRHRIAVWPDGKCVLLTPHGLGEAGELDFEKVLKFVPVKLYYQVHITRDRQGGAARRWLLSENELWKVTSLSLSPPSVRTRSVARVTIRPGERRIAGLLRIPGYGLPDSPIDRNRTRNGDPIATAWKNTVWMGVNNLTGMSYRKRDGLLMFKPAPVGGKGVADQWVGPFQMPDGKRITNLWNDGAGHVWVTTPGGVYRVDAETLLGSKLAAAHTRTKQQWRKQYQKRLDASNWRCRVRACAVSGQWPQALRILDTQRKLVGQVTGASDAAKKGDHEDLLMWRALVAANMPDGVKRAIGLYDRIASDPFVGRAAKRRARVDSLMVLCKTRQYEEALRRSGEFYRLYPPRRRSSSSRLAPSSLEYHLDKARKAVMTKNSSKAPNK